MGTAKHTPGQWFVDDVEGNLAIAAEDDGEVLAYLAKKHQQTNVRSADKMAAYARLIAAAPELLEALIAALSDDQPYIAKARAAIAKATGDQP